MKRKYIDTSREIRQWLKILDNIFGLIKSFKKGA